MMQAQSKGGMHTYKYKTKTAVTAATVRRLGAHTGTHKSSESSIASEQQKINDKFSVCFLCERINSTKTQEV